MNRILPNLPLLLALLLAGGLRAQYVQDATIGLADYVDISGTGTLLGAGDDDEYQAVLPFDFIFYGTTYEAGINVTVADNGVIVMDDDNAQVGVVNVALPTATFGDALFPMWEDLDADQSVTTDAGVYTDVLGSAPNRIWVVQWNMTNYFADTDASDVITFQAQLVESTNEIRFLYQDVDADPGDDDTNGQAATTGIQGGGGQASQFTFNEFIASGTGVSFDDPNDDIDILPPGVEEVALAAIAEVNVTLNAECQALVIVEQLLSGDFDVDGNDTVPGPGAFMIVVQDDDPSNGAIIDGCGTFQWTITADPEMVSGFTTAWGNINAEDKTSPELDEELVAPDPIYCDEVVDVDISLLPGSVSRCWIQSGENGQTLNNSMNAQLRIRLLAGGGIPNFTDGCSNVEICVNDIVTNTGPCNEIVITRTFIARDGLNCTAVSGEENPPAVYNYDIIFTRPSIDDVVGVTAQAIFECDETFELLPTPNQFGDINPAPRETDYPYFDGPNGRVYLDDNFCNIGATFEDAPRIQTCPQTYKFVRTFTVIDWCQPETVETYNQLVKVGDFEAPDITPPSQDLDFNGMPDPLPLIFSTTNFDCSANFIVPFGNATDNCDDNPTVQAYVLPNGQTDVSALGPFVVGGAAFEIPIGEHVLRYIARDACDNADTLDVPIRVEDRTAPQAICEDGLDVSLGGAGNALIVPEDIDRASRDECSEVSLLVAYVDDNNMPLNDAQTFALTGIAQGGWRESIILTCEILDDDPDSPDFVSIGLQATDEAGNANACWMEVLVEDKLAPTCVAPGPETFLCNDPEILTLPQDLNAAFAVDPDGTAAQLDATFGNANGLDNCGIESIDQTVQDTRNSCGVGQIIRTFSVRDGEDLVSPNTCIQFINVLGVHDYTIRFPADQGSEECIEPDYDGITFEERGCDLITTTTRIDTFQATADECYKLRITYEVLNWCEYSTEENPYTVPRDADDDNFLEEPTWLHVLPRALNTLNDDIAYLDQDGNRFNGFISPLDLHDPAGQVFGSSTQPYGTDEARGAFLYRQFIKVYDDLAPELTVVQPDEFGDEDGDCVEDVTLNFTINDDCTAATNYDAFVQLDAFFGDTDGSGDLSAADFVPSSNLTNGEVTNNLDGTFAINLANLPLGRHAVRIRATDGCGNASIDLIIFEVVDRKAPTPVCINGLTVTLMPDGEGGGMAAVWANEYVVSGQQDCTGPVQYAIYRDSEASDDDFEGPNPVDTGLIATCDDDATLIVRVYAIDALGNNDYCQTTLLVQPSQADICADGAATGSIQGTILTEDAEVVAGVEVSVSGGIDDVVLTSNQGIYAITELPLGEDYTVAPTSEDYSFHSYDVSTLDLVFITQHILGLSEFTSPYQYLAADADNSQSVSVTDIVTIRRLILGLDAGYPNNSAWRFVDGEFIFPNQTNPWATTFPEVFNINNLPGDIFGADFIAVMVGNVSGEYSGGFSGGQSEARTRYALSTEATELKAGDTYTIDFTAAQAESLLGFQGTLELGEGLELLDIEYAALAEGNFNLNRLVRGELPLSFHRVDGLQSDERLFSLVVRARAAGQLTEHLGLSSAAINAEAYDRDGTVGTLGIDFGDELVEMEGFELYQNTPNPVAERTTIRWNQVNAGQAELTVRDVAGRTLLVRRVDGLAGPNRLELDASMLPAGVLTYSLVAGGEAATKTMIVSR